MATQHKGEASSSRNQPSIPNQKTTNRKDQGLSAASVQISAVPPSESNVDHRSFSANLFSTAPFRMLSWLTPKGVSEIGGKISALEPRERINIDSSSERHDDGPAVTKLEPRSGATDRMPSPQETMATESINQKPNEVPNIGSREPPRVTRTAEMVADDFFRAKTLANPRRKTSLDTTSPPAGDENKVPDAKALAKANSLPKDRTLHLKPGAQKVARTVTEITSRPPFFENVTPPGAYESIRPKQPTSLRQKVNEDGIRSPKQQQRPSSIDTGETAGTKPEPKDASTSLALPAPQSLSRLSPRIIDFMCDIFEEDGTQELDEWQLGLHDNLRLCEEPTVRLRRTERRRHERSYRRWKLFNEQALFDVFSNPRALVATFSTENGELLDSPSLWYCMVRLTRTVPSLVLHSMWISALALFSPQSGVDSPDNHTSGKHHPRLSQIEAECLLSICLHALAALAPASSVSQEMMVRMSKIRSRGYSLSSYSFDGDLPSWMREKYDDAFSNDLALRLARRICCSMVAQRRFSDLTSNTPSEKPTPPDLILNTFCSQMDLASLKEPTHLNIEGLDGVRHLGNMQVLVLDWAKTVIMHEWDGQPAIATGTALHGALMIICAMREYNVPAKKAPLTAFADDDSRSFSPDSLCRMDYMPDRLEAIEIPLEWLEFNPSPKMQHILDYPLLFNKDSIVKYFRCINFSRMSRSYEEASSLRSRMDAIVDTGSLITNPHHKLVLQDLLQTASDKYLVLSVSREHILRDAFDELLRRERRELLRPLKVHLGEESGELGFDSGGVQQEFFRLVLGECLDPKYGAFITDDRTRMAWFMPGSVVEPWRYELIGLLVSLAIFNGLTLPVTFPLALYRKLLGWPVTELAHIDDGWPDLASGLSTLGQWDEADGLVEDVFARTYEFSLENFGSHVTRAMDKEEASWPQTGTELNTCDSRNDQDEAADVTGANRDEYVSDYIRYLTDISVRPQFEAFQKGFNACLSSKSLTLLSPELLQSIVEGEQEIDISELRRHVKYVDYSPSDRVIKDFWSIVKRYDMPTKRKLLEFVTASDRVPTGGISNVQFVIHRGSEEKDSRLPSAYTCFGILMLPNYSSKEILREQLAMALKHAQGFGFL